MSNPLFQALGGGRMPVMPGPMDNMMNMVRQFKQFRQSFQGDPKAEVQKLLQSGKMTQAQLNQLQGMARQFQAIIGQMK